MPTAEYEEQRERRARSALRGMAPSTRSSPPIPAHLLLRGRCACRTPFSQTPRPFLDISSQLYLPLGSGYALEAHRRDWASLQLSGGIGRAYEILRGIGQAYEILGGIGQASEGLGKTSREASEGLGKGYKPHPKLLPPDTAPHVDLAGPHMHLGGIGQDLVGIGQVYYDRSA